ncbi:MAG: wax ester/triacylglycerol synthase family O-acyltransferase [Deltaproteobacteria bacterium]|nr:wax ester/triacylglycerol synthase family O-acyltransferase [Deltaproteobacteria bacterium]MBW2359632.1 wax ester/triacylglycerol synthase family O-acyltransferase [Deltaproteobacteria bacterium]
MRRLTAADAMFLYNELPSQHMHTLKLATFDYSEVPGGYSFESQKQKLAARLDCLPPLRWRMVTTPLGLNHPLWIEEPDLDLDYHVRRAAIPAPGGPRELCSLVEEIASRQLDRNRPLWELWMIEGLEGGQVAALMKLHHSLADGVASAEMLRRVLSPSSEEETADPSPRWEPELVPTKGERLRLALRDLAGFLAKAVPRSWRSLRRNHRVRGERKRRGAVDPPRPWNAPPTFLNRELSPQRRFAYTSVSLDDAKAIRTAFGCSINEVLLATVAGGLRSFLFAKGELPGVPLIVSVPVSTRQKTRAYGNGTGVWYVHLPTQLDDPVARVRAVQRAVRISREEFADTAGARLTDWMELVPPVLLKQFFTRLPLWLLKAGRAPMANFVVSNVRGPARPLLYDGALMTGFYSVGPLLHGVALNVTCWSYADQMNVSLLGCRNALPDLWELTEQIGVAFEALLKASATLPVEPTS